MPSCPPKVLAGTEMPSREGEGTIPNVTPPATVLHPSATILHSDVKQWEPLYCFTICEGLSHKTMESWKQTQINIHLLLSVLPLGQTSSHNLHQRETSCILSVHTIFSSVKPVLSWACTQSSPVLSRVCTQPSPTWNQFYLEGAHNLRQCESSFISGVSGVVLTLTVYGTLHTALQKIASWVQPKKKGGREKKTGKKRCTVKAKAQHMSLWSGNMLLTLSFPKCPCLQYCLCLTPSLYWCHDIAGKLFNQRTTKSNKQADGTESTRFTTLPVRSWTASQHNTLCG